MSDMCPHLNFEAHVDVNRLTDVEGDDVIAFSADVEISCTECGEHFRFIGVPAGLSPDQPTMDVTGKTIHLPIRPSTGDPDFGLGIPGFKVRYSEA